MGRSSYPGQLDTDLELPRVDGNVTEIGGDSINALRDAIFSIESALGVNPQGNKASLADRVNVSIDSNGNLRSSALESAGLVSLPINDSHISSTADIAESKLDLDYSTSSLNSRINSANTNISAVEQSINTLTAADINHYNGTTGRHDGYDIDLQYSIRGRSTVEEAINEVNNAFIVFESSTNTIFSVVNVSSFNSVTSDISNIQSDALSNRDRLYDTIVLSNKNGEQGSQGNLVETTLASTVFKTETSKATNILQVMRPNVARVSGKTPNLSALVYGSKDKLRIQAGGVDRDPLDVDFGSPSILPTKNLDDVVSAINTEARLAANHYPISAYNINGKLVIAHNIPGPSYTISIENVSKTAHTELGFGDVLSTDFNWSEYNHGAHISGDIITDMKPLMKIRYTHSGGDTLSPNVGDLLTLFGVSTNAQGRIICNILNHSVTGNNNNGSYYIIGFPTSEQLQLNSSVPAGEFDIEIVADSVNFDSTADEKIYDIFLEKAGDGYDGYGIVTKELRVQHLSISGISIKTVNKTFPTSGTIQWSVTGGNTLLLKHNGDSGSTVDIPSGFTGELKAFMPDNVNSAIFEVTGTVSSTTKAITPYAFSGTDDKLYLSSVTHPLGTSIIRYVYDKRKVGDKFYDELDPENPENVSKDLRSNGIVRGFDVISNTSNTIKVRGGRAIVKGKTLDVETTDVGISSFNGAFRLLALDKNGIFVTFDAYEPGYTDSELDGYGHSRDIATIVSFGTSLTGLTGSFVDRRLFIDKIDGRLSEAENRLDNRINQLASSVGGIMWGFTQTYSTEPYGEYIASINVSSNPGFRYLEEPGFLGNQTTRRYEFLDPNTDAYSVFKAPGLTHINVMVDVEFADQTGSSPFGVSGEVDLDIGASILTGVGNDGYSEQYVTVKTMNTTILPSNSVTERYVASIPTDLFNLSDNVMFDIVPRIRVVGSTYVDGGGGGSQPIIKFGKVRVITSSYSVAGNVSGEDGSTISLGTNLGNVL